MIASNPAWCRLNWVQTYWNARLERHGFNSEGLLEPATLRELVPAADEDTWGFSIIGDYTITNNIDRAYTRAEAEVVAAQLLEIGEDPHAWTATVVPLPEEDDDGNLYVPDEPGYAVYFVWHYEGDPEGDYLHDRWFSAVCRS